MADPAKPHLEQGVLFDLFTDPVPRHTPEYQHLHFLALAQVPGLGQASLRALYGAFPVLADVWNSEPDELCEVLKRARLQSADKLARTLLNSREQAITAAANELDELGSRGVRLILDTDIQFPEKLRPLPNAPRWLFVRGEVELLSRESSVAVVGTREASPTGINVTRQLCELLVSWGFVVVSGLAEGIDAAAHRTTVDLRGDTIAVLGTGINIEFPAGSSLLRERIIERGGAVITEYLPDAMYSKASFVQRNRIQAGLANVVIPVESRAKSGTAHTVRFAEEYGRRLVGVWNQRCPSDLRSEILLLLISRGYPVFNLASQGAHEELWRLLKPYGGDAVPRSVDERVMWRSAYGPALRGLRAAVAARPPEVEAIEWITNAVHRILNEQEHADGDQGGLFRS